MIHFPCYSCPSSHFPFSFSRINNWKFQMKLPSYHHPFSRRYKYHIRAFYHFSIDQSRYPCLNRWKVHRRVSFHWGIRLENYWNGLKIVGTVVIASTKVAHSANAILLIILKLANENTSILVGVNTFARPELFFNQTFWIKKLTPFTSEPSYLSPLEYWIFTLPVTLREVFEGSPPSRVHEYGISSASDIFGLVGVIYNL